MITRVPVDILNPGHVFASLGIVEAIEAFSDARVTSRFVMDGGGTVGTFEIDCSADEPVVDVIGFLRNANVTAIAPRAPGATKLETTKWNVESERGEPDVSEIPVPRSPATLPARLRDGTGRELVLDSWGDDRAIGRDNVKFWAGSGGYPGAALARDAVDLLRAVGDTEWSDIARDPFAFTAPMSSSFRFDWRRDYVPLEVGFSPNAHTGMTMIGYPIVELLAAVGLENSRPARVKASDKLHYRYGTWHESLPTSLARVALGAVELGFARRTFLMNLNWPGQENQARCIVSVQEESS